MEEDLDNNVLKLLACVKYKHKNINNIISDPEMYLLIEEWMEKNKQIQVNEMISNFVGIINFISRNSSISPKIRSRMTNKQSFIPRKNTDSFGITYNNQNIFEFALARIVKAEGENILLYGICNDLNQQAPESLNDEDIKKYQYKLTMFNKNIEEQSKSIKINSEQEYNNICKQINQNTNRKEQLKPKPAQNKNNNIVQNNRLKDTNEGAKRTGNGIILENENENTDLNNSQAEHGFCHSCNCNCWPFN